MVMTYDEWFRSKQGVPYEGAYVFAQDAWTYQGDTIAELRAELEESDALREKLAKLLAETAVALKGEEAANFIEHLYAYGAEHGVE
jgi:hypothetical protein